MAEPKCCLTISFDVLLGDNGPGELTRTALARSGEFLPQRGVIGKSRERLGQPPHIFALNDQATDAIKHRLGCTAGAACNKAP